MLSRQELRKIFYSSITTKTLFWVRSRTFFISFLLGLKHLFKKPSSLPGVNKPCLLFFSTEAFIDIKELNDFELLIYKEKVSKGLKLDLKKEEALMALAFLMPYRIQKFLYSKVYNGIESKLKGYDIRFFLCNSPELLNYPIAHYLKTRGIPSGTIQHGVYMPDYYVPNYYETDIADYVFVWGEVYKETFKKGGVTPERLHLCCPPFYFDIHEKDFSNIKAVFLGQQLYKLSPLVTAPYNDLIQRLADHYSKKGVRLHYKPHPREDIGKSLLPATVSKIELLPKKSVSPAFYNEYTHAFSVNSTALVKALCGGLACYQVNLEIEFPDMHFSKYSRIPTIYADTVEQELSLPVQPVTEQDIDHNFLNLKPRPTFENAQILKACIEKRFSLENV